MVGSATYDSLEGAGFPRRTGATLEEAPQLEEHRLRRGALGAAELSKGLLACAAAGRLAIAPRWAT